MSDYFFDEEPPRKKGGGGKRLLLILLVICLVSGLVGGGVYTVTQMVQPEGGWILDWEDETSKPGDSSEGGSPGGDSPSGATAGTIAGDSSAGDSPEGATAGATAGETSASAQPQTPGESQVAPADKPGSTSVPSGGVTVVDVSDVVEAALPAVVAITNTMVYENYRDYFGYHFSQGAPYEVVGNGSGIILGDSGAELWIVTNAHVVKDATSLIITFHNGATAEAYVKGTDTDEDLAMVGVSLSELDAETRGSIRAIELGDSDALRMGEGVIAIGNALGFGQSVTTGCVSAVNREIQMSDGSRMTLLQTDAAINPGNSGGALLNREGQLVGINVAKLADSEIEGIGFAIPISRARDILDDLTLIEAPSQRKPVSDEEYPYLGVQLKAISETMVKNYGMPAGILVYYVEENGPTAQAGVLANDIITTFDGQSVTSYEELNELLPYYAGGTDVTLTVMRMESGQYVQRELTVTLGFRSEHE